VKTSLPSHKLLAHKFIRAFLLCLPLYALAACDNQTPELLDDIWDGSEDEVCAEDVTTVNFKQIAYWSISEEETLDDINFNMLTHIIYSKIGVKSDGELIVPTGDDLDQFEEMIDLAQTAGVYAMVSFGNSNDSVFNSIAASDSVLEDFADNVEEFIKKYNLDGVDIDWRFPASDDEGDLFEVLVKEISERADNQGVLFSYIVDSGQDDDETDDGVQDDALAYPDFVNVMALNTTDDDDLHSSLEDAEEAITYWTNRCVVKNKLVLAIPLYSAGDEVLDFADIVEDDIEYACVDESEGRNYNGIATVNDKTVYAQSSAGGVILTSLQQDSFEQGDYYSILAAVDWQVAGGPNDICD